MPASGEDRAVGSGGTSSRSFYARPRARCRPDWTDINGLPKGRKGRGSGAAFGRRADAACDGCAAASSAECSVCDQSALAAGLSTPEGTPGTGYENQLISQYVRTGKAKLM
jgi:hypothetical protein